MNADINEAPQFLCSHLISIEHDGRSTVANLERIWAEGATVNSEDSYPEGTELLLPDLGTTAQVTFSEEDASGHYLDLEFTPPYRWTPDKFRPHHLTDPALIAVIPEN
jgi:hypothetical protein